MFHDLRYTLRLWVSRPWHTAFAIAALAIGIGANTGVFSVVNALLLRSLPFHEPERLALFRDFFPPHDSAKEFHDWRQRSAYLADAALFEESDVNLGGMRVGNRAHVAQTTWNFFSMLGTQPVLGTGFAPDEDVNGTGWGLPGRNAVAVIGYGLWQQLFGGDPKVLGATIRIDGNPLTVVGVAPPGFDFPGRAVLWKPAAFSPGNNGWGTVARLKPGISWPQARAALAVEVERLSSKQGGMDYSPPAPEYGFASGRACRPPEERLSDVHGRSVVGPADCMHECRQPPDCPNHRTRRRDIYTYRAGGKPGQAGTTVTHRMPIPLIRCHSRRIGDRLLDNRALGKD